MSAIKEARRKAQQEMKVHLDGVFQKENERNKSIMEENAKQEKILSDIIREINSNKKYLKDIMAEIAKSRSVWIDLENNRSILENKNQETDIHIKSKLSDIEDFTKNHRNKIDNDLKNISALTAEAKSKLLESETEKRMSTLMINESQDILAKAKQQKSVLGVREEELKKMLLIVQGGIKKNSKLLDDINKGKQDIIVRENFLKIYGDSIDSRVEAVKNDEKNNNEFKDTLKSKEIELNLREAELSKRDRRVNSLIETHNLKGI
jgi:hypothetical protein